jgi:hypothetical protein
MNALSSSIQFAEMAKSGATGRKEPCMSCVACHKDLKGSVLERKEVIYISGYITAMVKRRLCLKLKRAIHETSVLSMFLCVFRSEKEN